MQSNFINQLLRRGRFRPSRQAIIMMKLVPLFLLICCFQVAARTNGQTVNLSVNKGKLSEVLKQIQLQTGYNIMAEQTLLEKAGKRTVTLKNASIDDAFETVLQGLAIDYVIQGKTVVLTKSKSVASGNNSEPIVNAAPATPIVEIAVLTVSGTVTNEEGTPLNKVSVFNVNTRKGTTTNDKGVFQIEASKGDVLVFSYVGFKPQQVKVGEKTNLTIVMELQTGSLEEFIATGYQNIRKKDMVGAVSRVKAEDLLINGTNTIEQMLQGKLAGVEVVNNSGLLGTRQTVRVRGVSTLLGNQQPVWVVDGIIQEDPLPFQAKELNRFNQEPSNSELLKNFIGGAVSWLNPYDIEDVTVLKDAASTAIYGVKAANGVILINTKRGAPGRTPTVSYNTSLSTQSKLTYDKMNLMNSKERVDVSREIWERGLNAGQAFDDIGYTGLLKKYLEEKLSYDEFNAGVKQLEVNNTDWLDILMQQPISQAHNLSISGGSTNSSYYGSLGVNSQKGQAKGNGSTGYQGSINFTSNITPKLSVSFKIAGNYSKTDGFYKIDPYSYAYQTSRVIRAYNDDGTLFYYKNPSSAGMYNYNIINELQQSGNSNYKTGLNSNVSVRYRFANGFSFESILGINYTNVSSELYATEKTSYIAYQRGYEYGAYGPLDALYKQSKLPHGGVLSIKDNSNYNYTWRNGLNYGRTFNKKHVVTGLLGLEFRSNIEKEKANTDWGYMPDRGRVFIPPPVTYLNAAGIAMPNPIFQTFTTSSVLDRTSNYVSYYATGGYTYDNRYIASLSVRGDASNRFGQDVRTNFNPIWAAGARWNIGNEKFFDRSGWMNNLSLRASYGYQGNVAENYGPDLILTIPTSSGTSFINALTGEPLYRISRLPYANLRWEKTQTVNLGLDFNFFGGKVSAAVDYYNKRSRDLIVLQPVPYENGVTQMPTNGGTLYNSGFEIALNFIPVRTKDFTWTIGINSAKNFNKITSRQIQNPIWNTAQSGNLFKEGYAVSSFWVFDFTGVDSATGIPLFNLPTASIDPNAKFDATAFMKYAGKKNADITGGFNTSIRYKSLTISSSIYASVGNHKLLPNLYNVYMIRNTPYEYANLTKDLVNRWRQPGDNTITDIPSLPQATVGFLSIPSGSGTFDGQSQGASETPYTLYNYSTARLVNASYLRVNNIAVNYIIPARILKNIYSKTASIGYSLSNVYTWVSKDYKGVDPEVASGSQPLPKVHSINLGITF